MRVVACEEDDPDCSPYGPYHFVADDGWVLGEPFIDFESGFLIIRESLADDSSTTSVSVVVSQTGIALTAQQWSEYFDYEPKTTRSADGRFDLISQRLLGEDGGGDSYAERLIDVATGDQRAESTSSAFRVGKRFDLIESNLKREARERKHDEKPKPSSQRCPRCGRSVIESKRYPDYLCQQCASLETTVKDGRRVSFTNISIGKGFRIVYWSDGVRNEQDDDVSKKKCVCFIDGDRYLASARRFGGIVIRPALK